VLALVSMVAGNLVAIAQKNIKRLLAYSSIGQAGYLLLGFAALGEESPLVSTGILFHLVGYAAATLLAFVVIIAVSNLTGKEEIADYDGLAERAPLLAMVLSAAFFSSAGLPIFAGFTTKFYLFTAAANANGALIWLVGIAITMSLVSLYYYLVVIKHMYIHEPKEQGRLKVPAMLSAVVLVLFAAIVLLGVYPGPIIDALEKAAQVLI